MPETTGIPRASAACAIPSIACASSCAIDRLLGVAEVEAVGEPDRLAAGARDVAGGAERRLDARAEAVGLAGRGALQRDREPAQRRPQTQDGRVETRPADRARADEVVVLLDHLAHVELRRLEAVAPDATPRRCSTS